MIKSLFFWTFRPYSKFACFSGRSPRREFWGFLGMCMMVIGIMSVTTLAAFYTARMTGSALGFRLASGMLLSFYIVNIIPFFALITRRFHDIGKSGWMTLLIFIPIIGSIIVFSFMGKPGMRSGNEYGNDLVPNSVTVPVFMSRLQRRVFGRFQRLKTPSVQ